jgi:hypothetical protein
MAGLVLLGPFYFWALYKVFGPQEHGDLSGILILLLGPLAVLYLGVVAMGGEASRASGRRRSAREEG